MIEQQSSLPGLAGTPTENRATLEADLRGEVALALMALLTWAEFHGARAPEIGITIEKFLALGKPDTGISRAIAKVRSLLGRYLAHGGTAPEWLPPSVLALLSDTTSDALPAQLGGNTRNLVNQSGHSGQSRPNSPQERPAS
ncbi:MAG: hypothetical protein ABSB49_09775 [Polyangia bacterium]|jgi:hypothetical protein